jgi:hypothetical protein
VGKQREGKGEEDCGVGKKKNGINRGKREGVESPFIPFIFPTSREGGKVK